MLKWVTILLTTILFSCSQYSKITYIDSNYHEDVYQSNYDYSYNYGYKLNDSYNDSSDVDTNEVFILEKISHDAINKNKVVVDYYKESDISPKIEINKIDKDVKDISKEQKKKIIKSKKENNKSIIKWSIILSVISIFIISPTLGIVITPTILTLIACILYPIWLKKGYLDNIYLKLSIFLAAYGGLIANFWWLMIFLGI